LFFGTAELQDGFQVVVYRFRGVGSVASRDH
jgi:hypothetical protein